MSAPLSVYEHNRKRVHARFTHNTKIEFEEELRACVLNAPNLDYLTHFKKNDRGSYEVTVYLKDYDVTGYLNYMEYTGFKGELIPPELNDRERKQIYGRFMHDTKDDCEEDLRACVLSAPNLDYIADFRKAGRGGYEVRVFLKDHDWEGYIKHLEKDGFRSVL